MGYVLDRGGLDGLLRAIQGRGFRLVGPVVADGAICYGDIASSADLPAGWTDEQDGGTYRLKRRDDDALFGYNVGPQSPKKYLFPASATLWRSADPGTDEDSEQPLAFIGVRACELRAIAIQDRVLVGGAHQDPLYARHREGAFIVAVNCGQSASTCFCVSMSAGPEAGVVIPEDVFFFFRAAVCKRYAGDVHHRGKVGSMPYEWLRFRTESG